MINWLTENIGTGGYLQVAKSDDFDIVDVRNLVDKDGNSNDAILDKINESLSLLKQHKKIVICCDYGMSRSNSIAAAVISKYKSIPLSDALIIIQKKVPEQGIKLDVINAVFGAIEQKKIIKQSEHPRLLITGGSGFVGSSLTLKLKDKYFVRSISSKEIDLIHNPVLLDLYIKENDITTIVHLANPRIYTVNIALGDSLVMLKNVLEICRLNRVRVIFVSSWEVYSGYKSEELSADETLPIFPKGSYGESKWLSEELIRHYHKIYGLNYIILRASPVYGENTDKPKFIYNFIDMARRNETITTHKYLNGYPKLDLLYIDDFILLIIKSIALKGSHEINAGSGELISTKTIAEMIVRKFDSKSAIESNTIDTYYSNIKIDFKKALELTGWKPESNFQSFVNRLEA